MDHSAEQLFALMVIGLIVALVFSRSTWKPNLSAHGQAHFAPRAALVRAGMLQRKGGLPLGRGLATGTPIWLNDLVHVLLVGGAGSGKGIGIILPALLSWMRSSIVCFDTKGDLHDISAPWRVAHGQRIIRLAPFNGGTDAYNVLDSIAADSPLLVDRARAIAAALVFRLGTEHDGHWQDKAEQVICALICLVLLRFEGEERSLNGVQEIASNTSTLLAAASSLQEVGGIPARLGNQILGLFAPNEQGTMLLTREGSGVMSTVARYLAFLDSELVACAVNHSTFQPSDLLRPRITLFIQIPPDLLDAQKGLLRLWVASLIREVARDGNEAQGEVLFLLDEAAALGGLAGLEEVLVRGRSAGCRVLLAYQSESQVRAAFKDKPTLISDNCPAQIFLCPPSGLETAEKLAKGLGDRTLVVDSVNEGYSRSAQQGGVKHGSPQVSRSEGRNWSLIGRNLLRPEEIMNLPDDRLIAFVRGVGAPILCRRLSYFNDPLFGGRPPLRPLPVLWWVLLLGMIAAVAWQVCEAMAPR